MTVSLILLFYFSFFVIKQTETQKKNLNKACRRRGRVAHRWLWGAPSCRCGRCRTVAPASGPDTRTSPGPRSAPDRSGGRPSHAERLYLETHQTKKQKKKLREREKKRHSNSADHQKDQLIQGGIKAIRFNLFFRSANRQMGSLSADREMNQL